MDLKRKEVCFWEKCDKISKSMNFKGSFYSTYVSCESMKNEIEVEVRKQ